jgi:hypothetical protein
MGVGDSARSFKRIKAQIPSNVFNEGHVCVTEQHRIELVELPEDVTQTTLATTHSFIYNELVFTRREIQKILIRRWRMYDAACDNIFLVTRLTRLT